MRKNMQMLAALSFAEGLIVFAWLASLSKIINQL
jgi:hypothetical protein